MDWLLIELGTSSTEQLMSEKFVIQLNGFSDPKYHSFQTISFAAILWLDPETVLLYRMFYWSKTYFLLTLLYKRCVDIVTLVSGSNKNWLEKCVVGFPGAISALSCCEVSNWIIKWLDLYTKAIVGRYFQKCFLSEVLFIVSNISSA